MTLNDVVASWREIRDIESATVKSYDRIIASRIEPTFGKMKVRDIDRNRIHSWLHKLERTRGTGPLGSGTKKLWLAVFKVVLAHAVEIGAIGAVPQLDRKRTPKAGESRKRILSPDEEVLALAYCGQTEWLRPIITVTINQALREGEVAALRWEEIDFANNKLTVRHSLHDDRTLGPPKGKKVCTIDLTPKTREALLSLEPAADGFVFTDEYGQPFRPTVIARAFKRACKLADLKVTNDGKVVFHSLRHTGISRLANHPKVPLVHVRDFARHSDLAITQSYVHKIESEEIKTAMAEALS
jgi:integrase